MGNFRQSDHNLSVPSPTFALRIDYPLARFAVTHADLYRLAGDREIDELGLQEALETGALIIEWPDRLRHSQAAERLDIVRPLNDKGAC